jgi:chloramphenicol O-acetyltransferase type B
MRTVRFARILLGKLKNTLTTSYYQAQIQEKLITTEPTLAGAFALNASVDRASSIGAHSMIFAGGIVESSTVGPFVKVGKGAIVKESKLEGYAYVGEGCFMQRSTLGKYSYTGANDTIVDTTIGNFCSIAQGLSTGSGNHPTHLLSTSPAFYMRDRVVGISFAETDAYHGHPGTTIGHDVWIGANVFIKSGLTIGNGAIIAAGAVVMKDVAPYTIVGKVPAEEIRKRFSEVDIAILEELQWWYWSEADLRAATPLFQTSDVKALQQWKAAR